MDRPDLSPIGNKSRQAAHRSKAMSDTSPKDKRALLHNAPKAAPRQPHAGELLCEFYSASRKKFYRIELRDRGQYGVEAQLFDPTEFLYGQLFSHRELAIAWATNQRNTLEKGGA